MGVAHGKDPFDSTIPLLRDPYRYIGGVCRRLDRNVFDTRILLEKTICMRGRKAAALFYDRDRFRRRGAAPAAVQKTLFGVGGVQGLDGAAHEQRKALFMEVVAPERVARLAREFETQLRRYAQGWTNADRVVLYDQLCGVLTRAVCRWAGVPLAEAEVALRTKQLRALFDQAGSKGPKHFAARRARHQAERWLETHIGRLRDDGEDDMGEDAASLVARHLDQTGKRLPARVAAVELLNVLRPVVAAAVFVTFVPLALHEHPEVRNRVRHEGETYTSWFVQEVRRFYPFFPFVAARVAKSFQWQGYEFVEGRRVLLDLYGTDHDPETWAEPERFLPERFAGRASDPFDFVPQGGGHVRSGHRCPGEGIVVALMEVAASCFAKELDYVLPQQDLRINFARMPALPRSGLVMANVRGQGAADEG